MQNLIKLIAEAKKKAGATDQQLLNIVREYLQVLILKALYQSKYGAGLSFMGGTCLRICRNIKRYSEDLDFALDGKIPGYSFAELNKNVASFLRNTDFEVDLNVQEGKVVQKSFIRVSKIIHATGLSPMVSQKIHIKMEIDTNPVPVSSGEIETHFVTKFDEMFPVLKHNDSTMFAGKICAILNRAYTKGRDFYDLMWYLTHNTDINFSYLNNSQKQAGLALRFDDNKSVMQAVSERIKNADVAVIMKDIHPFLEDISEETWIFDYDRAFNQVKERFLKRR